MMLLASPEPLPEESRSSWIQRVCAAHDYSMKRLCECFGIRSARIDWDFGVDGASWQQVVLNSGRSGECFENGVSDWAFLCDLHCGPIRPWFVNSRPASKWCPICLATDSIPYLRWYWRIEDLHTCPYHDAPLSTTCPWCQETMNLSLANLVPWGRHRGAENLAGCASCGMPFLAPGGAEAIRTIGESARYRAFTDPLRALRLVLTRRALASWGGGSNNPCERQSGHLEAALNQKSRLLHIPWVPDRSQKRGAQLIQDFSTSRPFRLLSLNRHWTTSDKRAAVEDMLKRNRARAFRVSCLTAVSRSPRACKLARKDHFWSPEELTSWSAYLSPPSRILLAKARLIMRRERAFQRERAVQGLTEKDEQAQIDKNVEYYKWGGRGN